MDQIARTCLVVVFRMQFTLKTTFNLFTLLQASCFVTNKQIPCTCNTTHHLSLPKLVTSFSFINHQAEFTTWLHKYTVKQHTTNFKGGRHHDSPTEHVSGTESLCSTAEEPVPPDYTIRAAPNAYAAFHSTGTVCLDWLADLPPSRTLFSANRTLPVLYPLSRSSAVHSRL